MRQYRPTKEIWNRITFETEIYFEGINDIPFSKVELIDFNTSKVHLKTGKRIPFDGLSSDSFLEYMKYWKRLPF